ncbi:MAG TPA: hypothetical protein VGM06_19610 [Polyangiaceae bacterium]
MRSWPAKIASECPTCRTDIRTGDEVRWTAPAGRVEAVHATCPDPTPQPRRGRRHARRDVPAVKGDEQIISRPSRGVGDWYDVESTIYLPDRGWVTVLKAWSKRIDDTWMAFAHVRPATDEEVDGR